MINRHLRKNAITKQILKNQLYKICLSILTDPSIAGNLKKNGNFEDIDVVNNHSVNIVENVIKDYILSQILAKSVNYLDSNRNRNSRNVAKVRTFISAHTDLIEKYDIKPSGFSAQLQKNYMKLFNFNSSVSNDSINSNQLNSNSTNFQPVIVSKCNQRPAEMYGL